MTRDWRWLPLAATNFVLLFLTAMVNDGLAPWNVALFLAGPCVVWPALRLEMGPLVLCVFCSGLMGDALLPTPYGFLTTLFALGAGIIAAARPSLGRAGRSHQLVLAWALNAIYYLAFTLWTIIRGTSLSAAFIERLAVDFGLSQLLLLPVGLWFFDFQESVLRLAHLPVAQEPAGRI
jgi:hypothetical protein